MTDAEAACAVAGRWRQLAETGDPRLDAVARDHGLSRPMVDWGAIRWSETFRPDALATLARERIVGEPLRLGILLAGSVPSVAIEQTLLALAMGADVWVKTPGRQTAVMDTLLELIADDAPRLRDRVRSSADRASVDPLMRWATTVEAYGSDATLAELGPRAEAHGARWIPYGHRISIAITAPDAAPDAFADRVASDVVAFDQQGCMSPQAIFVPEPLVAPWGTALADALSRLAGKLPRGPLTAGQHAQIAQAKGIAAFTGRVWEATDAVVLHQPGLALRPSPAPRAIHVVGYNDWRDVVALPDWRSLPLSSIGAAGPAHWLTALSEAAAPLHGARVVPAGQMQFPRLDRPHDGRRRVHAWYA